MMASLVSCSPFNCNSLHTMPRNNVERNLLRLQPVFLPSRKDAPANGFVPTRPGSPVVSEHREEIQQVVLGAQFQISRGEGRPLYRQTLFDQPTGPLRGHRVEVLATDTLQAHPRHHPLPAAG